MTLQLPERWTGQPEPVPVPSPELAADGLSGIGASHGVVEGRARLIQDASEIEAVEPGDILVCPFTDPSWAPVFHLAGGLVIDVGGLMSHGAIVAREMGLPCVINTRIGTRLIHTGDRVRVDGSQGTVQILGPTT